MEGKSPDLLQVAMDTPQALVAGVEQYRATYGHAPNFERLHVFLRPTFEQMGLIG